MLEHIITSNTIRHVEGQRMLTDAQHGFRKQRSCETQLIVTIQDLAKSIDDKSQSDVILLDFCKAFDKVPHIRLMSKLHRYGIRGSLHSWIGDFLRDRTQTVILENGKSDSAPVLSGVPQRECHWSDTLYINDLPESIKNGSSVRLFADDCILYRSIKTSMDAVLLKEDLDALQEWEKDWIMEFHPHKCQVLQISNKRQLINHPFSIHGHILETAESARYLGVNIHNKLN